VKILGQRPRTGLVETAKIEKLENGEAGKREKGKKISEVADCSATSL